jgi:hypothetical protein
MKRGRRLAGAPAAGRRTSATGERGALPAPGEPSRRQSARWALAVFASTLLAHLLWLAGDLLWDKPFSPLFAGDALHYLEAARHLAQGSQAGSELPYHPPMTAWLLAPLWWLLASPPRVYAASKLLMAALNGWTWAATYLLLRRRLPLAGPLCLLGPLCFGELLLSSAASSEVPYRALLAGMLLLGRRWPLLGGALHAAAALTRVEHLMVVVVGALASFTRPHLRRWAGLTLGTAALLVLPYLLGVRADLREYNQRFAGRLAEPLPEWVPISFYGPLNFALAQREEGIFFSRRSLPPTAGGDAELDPTDPAHLEAIVHGYRLGLAEIADRPGRFVARVGAKLAFSLQAFGYGWSWRDLPKPGEWERPPVDLAFSREPLWLALSLLSIALGCWSLRGDRPLLLTVGLLLAYRLAVNAVFFPYLRGMMVAAPAFLVLFWAGWQPLLRGATRRALWVALLALALLHASGAWRTRRYLLAGERDEAGTILDDRRVLIRYGGWYEGGRPPGG